MYVPQTMFNAALKARHYNPITFGSDNTSLESKGSKENPTSSPSKGLSLRERMKLRNTDATVRPQITTSTSVKTIKDAEQPHPQPPPATTEMVLTETPVAQDILSNNQGISIESLSDSGYPNRFSPAKLNIQQVRQIPRIKRALETYGNVIHQKNPQFVEMVWWHLGLVDGYFYSSKELSSKYQEYSPSAIHQKIHDIMDVLYKLEPLELEDEEQAKVHLERAYKAGMFETCPPRIKRA